MWYLKKIKIKSEKKNCMLNAMKLHLATTLLWTSCYYWHFLVIKLTTSLLTSTLQNTFIICIHCALWNASAKSQDCNETQTNLHVTEAHTCNVHGGRADFSYFIWNELLVPLWSRSCDKQATNNANFSSGVNRFPNSSTCNPKIGKLQICRQQSNF